MRNLTSLAPAALLALLALPPSAADQDTLVDPVAGFPAPRYVASGGLVYQWDGASPKVVRAGPQGDLPGGSDTLGIESCADGERLLLLQETRAADGKERHRREGLALIFDASGEVPKRLHQVPFEGQPFGEAVTPDGSRAYVLARRPAPGGAKGAGRFWIHEIDLPAGRLLGSAQLSAAPADIVVQPDGRRVFVTLADRILSFSTGPLIGSWHYRSPGPNRDLVIRSGDGTLCVTRGEEVALFDPAVIAARGDAERHERTDDASTVIPLPFEARGLDVSGDGRLAAVLGPDRLAFLDCATQSIIWPIDPPVGLAGAAEVRTLAFPAAGRDLVVALFPAGDVAAFRSPAPSATAAPSDAAPDADAETETTFAAPAAPPAPEPVRPSELTPEPPESAPGPAPASAPASAPDSAPDVVPDPVSGQTSAPPPPTADRAADLSGRVKGDRSQVGAIVVYGPNSIVKEFGRTRPDPDGVWRIPLPPPGTYRLVPIGDGSTPLATSPAFLTVRVTADGALSGLDFEVRGR